MIRVSLASPVPFGGVLFADGDSGRSKSGGPLVTSAFRRSAVRGHFLDCPEAFTRQQSHQCLSAECCSRTDLFAEVVADTYNVSSPVPFGGVLFADEEK